MVKSLPNFSISVASAVSAVITPPVIPVAKASIINFNVSAISFWQFLLALGILSLSFLSGTLRWKIIIKSQLSQKVSFLDILIARIVGVSINYLTPVVFLGGQPIKAYILKERSKVSLDKVVVSIIIEEVIFLSVLLFFVILGVAFLFLRFPLPAIFEHFQLSH